MKQKFKKKPVAQLVIGCYFLPFIIAIFLMHGVAADKAIMGSIMLVSTAALVFYFSLLRWDEEWLREWKKSEQVVPKMDTELVDRVHKELQGKDTALLQL